MIQARQSGAALLLLLLVAVTGAAGWFLASGAAERSAARRAAEDAARLARASDMILGYALANARRPGELPFPDRHGDGNDDGNGDCITSWGTVQGKHLLGLFPAFLEQGCWPERPAFGAMLTDAGGHRLWYAVARSLVRPQDMLNSATDDGWLQVQGPAGPVAGQAAFVVFAPGAATGDQQRTANTQPGMYLDKVLLGGTLHDNADGDEQFVAASRGEAFNDRLAVMSRARFMSALTRRVARTLHRHLEAYRAAHGQYPFAALADGTCSHGLAYGFYPLAPGDCGTAPAVPPDWFANQWLAVTTYQRAAADQVTLQFLGCAALFSLHPGGLAQTGDCA